MKKYSFAKGFKRARRKAGYTQESFIKAFLDENGQEITTLKSVRNWEQGIAIPEFTTVEKICDFFHCDMDYLFNSIEFSTHDKQFIHNFTGLSEPAIDILSTHKYFTPRYIKSLDILIKDIAEGPATRSFIDIFSNYILFNTGSSERYALSRNGDIVKKTKPMSIEEDGTRFDDASKIYFNRKQLEQMYIMEMEDVLKSIKESYMNETNKKAPDKEK